MRKADQRSQVEAWGSALRRGASREEPGEGTAGWSEVLVWRVRGVLWSVGTVGSLVLGTLGEISLSMRMKRGDEG
jgi:hypothetical protein